MAEIRFEHITKYYGRVRAVNDVNLTIADGEFMVLLGPSGCGKTTMLRCLAGLEIPDEGTVFIDNSDVTEWAPRDRNLAMVFQNYAVFPHMNVYDNIAFGLRMRKQAKTEVREKTSKAAAMLQVDNLLDRYPAALSGGQRQRVAVARAIAMEPDVLLMDEPLSNLDSLLRMHMRAELKRLLKEIGATTLYVTHDQVEALSMGDRVAVMNNGSIVQVDEPMAVYCNPSSTFVGGFIGSPPMNFLTGRIEFGENGLVIRFDKAYLPAPAHIGSMLGQRITVGLRAEDIETSTKPLPGGVPTTVLVVEPLGSHLLLTVQMDDQFLKIVTAAGSGASPDHTLWLRPDTRKLCWLDAETGLALGV